MLCMEGLRMFQPLHKETKPRVTLCWFCKIEVHCDFFLRVWFILTTCQLIEGCFIFKGRWIAFIVYLVDYNDFFFFLHQGSIESNWLLYRSIWLIDVRVNPKVIAAIISNLQKRSFTYRCNVMWYPSPPAYCQFILSLYFGTAKWICLNHFLCNQSTGFQSSQKWGEMQFLLKIIKRKSIVI